MNKIILPLILMTLNLLKLNSNNQNFYILDFQANLLSNGYLISFKFCKNDLNDGQIEFKYNESIINIESIKYNQTEVSYLINIYDYKISNKELEKIIIQYNDFNSIKYINEFYIRNIDLCEFNQENNLNFEYPLVIYNNKTLVKKEYKLLSNSLSIPKDIKLSSTNYFILDKYTKKDLVYTSFYLYINEAKYLLNKREDGNYLYLYSTKEKFDLDDDINCKLSIIYDYKYYYKVDFFINLKADLYIDNSSIYYQYRCEVDDV